MSISENLNFCRDTIFWKGLCLDSSYVEDFEIVICFTEITGSMANKESENDPGPESSGKLVSPTDKDTRIPSASISTQVCLVFSTRWQLLEKSGRFGMKIK